MMIRRTSHDQKGFTILELLIATMVFSVIFLATTTAILQISKMYYKGVMSSRTQEVARGLVDQLSQQLQFGGNDVTPGVDSNPVVTGSPQPDGKLTFKAVCIGSVRYTYRINAQVSSSTAPGTYDNANSRLQHALWRDTVNSGCDAVDLSQAQPSPGGEEVLGQNMRLSKFAVTPCDSTTNICNISVGIIYGDNDLIVYDGQGVPDHCQSIIGSQWCAASQISTSVLKRVGAN